MFKPSGLSYIWISMGVFWASRCCDWCEPWCDQPVYLGLHGLYLVDFQNGLAHSQLKYLPPALLQGGGLFLMSRV